jgi:hypothetical protein
MTTRSIGTQLSALGLALCLMAAGITAPPFVRHAAAAPAEPIVSVTGHLTSHLPIQALSPERNYLHRLTLHIAGSGFRPGRMVRIAVITTSHWGVLARATTRVQPSLTWVCTHDNDACAVPNPLSGTFQYTMRLDNAPEARGLVVLYRSTGDPGAQTVTVR